MALILVVALLCNLIFGCTNVYGTTFQVVNQCEHAIWPAIQPTAGKPIIANGGFALSSGQAAILDAPAGWSGRIWARTACRFDSSGKGSCATGDCGGGVLECSGAGGTPPATHFEVTLDGYDGKDFYDVSLVDGYNLEIAVTPIVGKGECEVIGCTSDLNQMCPPLLQVKMDEQTVACKSACAAFDKPQFCCTGSYGTSHTCPPTNYSAFFKKACPQAYTYAFDDATSIFTCRAHQYIIEFCPL